MLRRRRFILTVLLAAVVLGVVVVSFWGQLERRFVFFPTREVAATPADFGVEFEDVHFTTSDGLRLNGWYVPGRDETVWLWFHGNGGDLGHRAEEMALFHHQVGASVFIFDYRGYGKSEGQPSEQGTYRDARAALEYLQGRPDASGKRAVYFGRSLGAAVAVELAVEHPPAGLVLVSPFTSLRDMAKLSHPILPLAAWAAGDRYDSAARIGKIHRPVLIIHGEHDEIVPVQQGEALFRTANDPKTFRLLPGAGHNDTFHAGGPVYWKQLKEFLDTLPD